jgi:hypothetical protein
MIVNIVRTASRHDRHSKRDDSGIDVGSSPPSSSQAPSGTERLSSTTFREPGYVDEDLVTTELPREVVAQLTPLACQFIKIAPRDYEGCQAFIRNNPDILLISGKTFVKAAQSAWQAGKRQLAESCLQQSLILRDCSGKNRRERDGYFHDLADNTDDACDEFEQECDEAVEKLQRFVAQNSTPSAGIPTNVSVRPILDRPKLDRHNEARSSEQNIPGRSTLEHSMLDRHNEPRFGEVGPLLQPPVSRRTAVTRRDTFSSVDSNAPSAPSMHGDDKIDDRYSERHSSFFVIGRVFATLWHTSFGSNSDASQDSPRSIGRFGEGIISHIQRMVVVKAEQGASWCIPINTYGGKGVLKFAKKFPISDGSKKLIEAHTIIYMSRNKPTDIKDKSLMTKESIEVRPASGDQKLDAMSRLNFAKVHTVEHNCVKVMDVGKIEGESLTLLRHYWHKKVEECWQQPQPQQQRGR